MSINPWGSGLPDNGELFIGNTGAQPSLATPTGDTNEIVITPGAGSLAIGIADNPVLPGNASYTWVTGTTAQEPSGSAGEVRYDTDTDTFRGYIDGTGWVDFSTGGGGGGMWELIASNIGDVGNGTSTSISGYSTYAITYNNVDLPAATSLHAGFQPLLTFTYNGGTAMSNTLYRNTTMAASYTTTTGSIDPMRIGLNFAPGSSNLAYANCYTGMIWFVIDNVRTDTTTPSYITYAKGWASGQHYQNTASLTFSEFYAATASTTGSPFVIDQVIFGGAREAPFAAGTFDWYLWGMSS